MCVSLEALKFNHDPASAGNDALTLRRNGRLALEVPEWRNVVCVHPEDSRAAYALRETLGQKITIQGKFRRTDANLNQVEVRAIAPIDPHGITNFWLRRAALRRYGAAGNILGEVAPTPVTFLPTGETGFETLELHNVQLWTAGVGIHTVTWIWQYRLQPAQPWTDFATSAHRIYTVLEVPKEPWQQLPYASTNTQLPWADVLDFACAWAAGAQTLEEAAERVTASVYALGPQLVEYDCPNGGSPSYAWFDFSCTKFLDLLRGGPGNGRYVNCSDCAAIVSTFANILGCDLWQSEMGNDFALNPILAIGATVWQPACNWPGFRYHEVSWKGACTNKEEVCDACLLVNGSGNPTGPPHVPLLPANQRFGATGSGGYRDRLATPAGRPNCNPKPGTRQRRRVV